MYLSEYLKLQKKDIRMQFCENTKECLVATTKERIYEHAKQHGWKIDSLNNTDKKKVLVINKESGVIPELWVSSSYTKYRDAYKKFLAEYFDIKYLPSCYHVDHFIPKGVFKDKHPEYFIHLMLLPQRNNCSFGSVVEKLQVYFESENEKNGGYHTSYINIAKLYGFSLPGKNSNCKQRDIWAKKFAKFLEQHKYKSYNNHYAGILSMVYRIYRNLNLNKKVQTSYGMATLHFQCV